MRALVIASLAALAMSTPVIAQTQAEKPERIVQMKDGTALHIYKDGKMSMHDSRDRPMSMKAGTKMETKSGEVIMMQGNEVWRQIRPNQIGD